MRVGVLGSGDVGQALAKGFAEKRHDVMLGTRSPDKPELATWKSSVPGKVAVGTFEATARHGEVVVLCCLGTAVKDVLEAAGASNLNGKVLIDATNALDFSKGMPPGLFTGPNESLGETVQNTVPSARVVKCFNIVPNPVMTHPDIGGAQPTMMIAGNDGAAKAQVVAILREFGWSGAIDLGGIENARWLEALVPLWVRVAVKLGNFHTAFKVLQ
ncbi:MAG TPA: NAD(P)-binding domain-containing protein [Thermoplasmata archaeon]|nr:NAD(P)-binding domain-containing protein [Thermoplasmata archaeon]